jgi:hypothetical protein
VNKPSDDNRDSTARLAEELESLGDGGLHAIARAIAAACQRNPELKEAIKNQCFNNPKTPRPSLAEIKLSYDKDGWTRTIRATDMKFQWTRFDTDRNVDTPRRFDTERSAYVRKLDWEADDDRMRKGRVSLVTPDFGAVDSKIQSADGTDLVTFQDIATAQNKSYEDKIQWFQDTCAQLCVEWNEGHMRMNVRREYLLSDSMEAVMSLSRKDLRKVWRFEFIGEAGIDAAREWFELVTEEVFDPDMGLWQTSATNQMCMQINPASGEFLQFGLLTVVGGMECLHLLFYLFFVFNVQLTLFA